MNIKTLKIYSIVLGIFFLISGFGKITDSFSFAILIQQYGFKSLMFLSPFIAILEVMLGLFLLLTIYVKRSAQISFFLLLIFTTAFAYGYFVNGIEDCGCFGTIKKLSTPPLLSFIRNFILLLISLLVWIKYPLENFSLKGWKQIVVMVIASISFFSSGLTFNLLYVKNVVVQKKEKAPKSKYIKKTTLNNFVNTHPDSTYVIFAFSYSCPHCLNSIENVNKYVENGVVDKVIGLGTGSEEQKSEFYEYFKPKFEVRHLERKDFATISTKVPIIFFVKNDSIKFIINNVAPSVLTLEKEGYLEQYFQK